MADPELGTKQVCPSCEAKFYDLNKRPATCPKCGHSFDPADETVQATKTKVRTAAAKEAVPEDEDEELEEEEAAKAAAATDEDEEESSEDQAKELGGDEDEVVLDMSGGDDDDEAPGKMPAGFSEDGVDSDEEDDDGDDIDLDEEFDLGGDIDLDDNNELGEPDADDIEPEGDDK